MQKWLLVDDDQDDQDIFEIALGEVDKGIRLQKSSNGVEALNHLRSLPESDFPSKVFMDINMPHMDGKECLREIKKDGKLQQIPVIMYTTSDAENEIEHCMKLGARDFVTKPTNVLELIRILRKFSNS